MSPLWVRYFSGAALDFSLDSRRDVADSGFVAFSCGFGRRPLAFEDGEPMASPSNGVGICCVRRLGPSYMGRDSNRY